ncbi:hypothetical protein BGZ94_002253, partial [Podila epigama]
MKIDVDAIKASLIVPPQPSTQRGMAKELLMLTGPPYLSHRLAQCLLRRWIKDLELIRLREERAAAAAAITASETETETETEADSDAERAEAARRTARMRQGRLAKAQAKARAAELRIAGKLKAAKERAEARAKVIEEDRVLSEDVKSVTGSRKKRSNKATGQVRLVTSLRDSSSGRLRPVESLRRTISRDQDSQRSSQAAFNSSNENVCEGGYDGEDELNGFNKDVRHDDNDDD